MCIFCLVTSWHRFAVEHATYQTGIKRMDIMSSQRLFTLLHVSSEPCLWSKPSFHTNSIDYWQLWLIDVSSKDKLRTTQLIWYRKAAVHAYCGWVCFRHISIGGASDNVDTVPSIDKELPGLSTSKHTYVHCILCWRRCVGSTSSIHLCNT
jgi:hypothetical protein